MFDSREAHDVLFRMDARLGAPSNPVISSEEMTETTRAFQEEMGDYGPVQGIDPGPPTQEEMMDLGPSTKGDQIQRAGWTASMVGVPVAAAVMWQRSGGSVGWSVLAALFWFPYLVIVATLVAMQYLGRSR